MEFKKILVAINGTKTDEEIIPFACDLAKKNKGTAFVTYVIHMERTLPLDAEVKQAIDKAEKALSTAEGCANNCNYKINTELLQARAIGPALIDESIEKNIDLIIIAMEYETRFGEFTLGDVAPYVLKNAPCHVLLWRERLPQINNPLVDHDRGKKI